MNQSAEQEVRKLRCCATKTNKLGKAFILGLHVKLEGNAFCQFLIGRRSNLEFEDYSQRCPEINLFGDSEHEGNNKLVCGTHKFKFSYRLPSQIPYSIESHHGHVRYKILAKLEIARGFDLKAGRKNNIGPSFDLSLIPGISAPMNFQETKSFCFLLCQSGQLVMRLHFPKLGFALGENISIGVHLENRSSAIISHTEFSLIRTDTFTSKSYHRVDHKIVAESSSEGVTRGKTESFLMSFEIPQDILVSSQFCSIYRISYELKFTAKVNGFHASPNILVPVTIGTF